MVVQVVIVGGLLSLQASLWGDFLLDFLTRICVLNVGQKIAIHAVVDACSNQLDTGGFISAGENDIRVLLCALNVVVHLWATVVDVLSC